MKGELKFFSNNGVVRVGHIPSDLILDALPPAVYKVGFSEMGGFFLEHFKERLDVPPHLFGTVSGRADKIIATYEAREKSTGALLTGAKGAGKTMLSSVVCNRLLDKGVPVLIIEDAYRGAAFNEFIGNVGNCGMLFDEFGKVFQNNEDEADPQDQLLSLFDGTGADKRLILLTENSSHMINDFMLNRPGRIFYHFEYDKVEEEVVRELGAHRKLEQPVIEELVTILNKSREFSFDILNALIEEYQRYGGSVEELRKDMNVPQDIKGVNEKWVVNRIAKIPEEGEPIELVIPRKLNTYREDYTMRVAYQEEIDDTHRHWDENKEGTQYTGNTADLEVEHIVKKEGNVRAFFNPRNRILVEGELVEEEPELDYKTYLAY